jgi:hypothetical protein
LFASNPETHATISASNTEATILLISNDDIPRPFGDELRRCGSRPTPVPCRKEETEFSLTTQTKCD